MKIRRYSPEIEAQMFNFYNSLSEKDRRRYAAIETEKLGYGGASYIQRVLHCDDRTIARGKQELKTVLFKGERIRKPGAGRKSILQTVEGINDAFMEVVTAHTAGSPVNENIKWTNLSRPSIAKTLKAKGFPVSVTVVDKLLKNHGFCRRQAFKTEAGKKTFPFVMSNSKILINSSKNIMMREIR